jgi:hypothetical protein
MASVCKGGHPEPTWCPRWPFRHGMTLIPSSTLGERPATARTHPAVCLKVSINMYGSGQGCCCPSEV